VRRRREVEKDETARGARDCRVPAAHRLRVFESRFVLARSGCLRHDDGAHDGASVVGEAR
jgi:hypothetical protein